jgi:D-amino peptidase
MFPEDLDERATFSRGKTKMFGMVDGIERGYDLAMFIGVHGRSGTGTSVLSHTFTDPILDVVVNGDSYGELGLNAALAGAYDVPVALVSGDQSVAAEARALFGDAVVTVVVKESRAYLAAESLHPKLARARLRDAAARAIRERRNVQFLRVTIPVTVEVSFAQPVHADLAAMIDEVERTDGRTIRYTRADMPAAYRVLRLITVLCSSPI